MNQISFTCSNNHPFKVPAKFAGKRAKCPKCGEAVTIPQVSTVNPTSQIISQSDDSRKRSRKRLRKEFKKTEHDKPALWAQLGAIFLFCVFGFAFFWGPIKMLWGLAFNAGEIAVAMSIYIVIMVAFLITKPQFSALMFVVGFLLSIATYFWPSSVEKAEANSYAVVKSLEGNPTLPSNNQFAVEPAMQTRNGVVHLASTTQHTKVNREPVGEEVTISQIKVFGRDWIGKKVRFSNVMFKELNNKQDDFLGIKDAKDMARDFKNSRVINKDIRENAQEIYKESKAYFVTFAFGDSQLSRTHNICEKQKWGDLLSRLRKYDEIVVEGEIVELEEDYYNSNAVGINVTHVELVKAYRSQ